MIVKKNGSPKLNHKLIIIEKVTTSPVAEYIIYILCKFSILGL